MVNRRASDGPSTQAPIAPVVKRKRLASCLGEQERRERKRAIDREAQRSLREKTKTHIAELERTIQILRDQDRHGTTSSLLSEIDVLRAENERLREVIDNVKSVIGCDLLPRNTATNGGTGDGGMEHSPAASSVGLTAPVSFTKSVISPPAESHDQFDYQEPVPPTAKSLDLDGMTIMTGLEDNTPAAPDPSTGMDLDLPPVAESPEHEAEDLSWSNDPATATWAPLMAEVQSPPQNSLLALTKGTSSFSVQIGAVPRRSSYTSAILNQSPPLHPAPSAPAGRRATSSSEKSCPTVPQQQVPAPLVPKQVSYTWAYRRVQMQSPVLQILKQVDDLLFCHLPNVERLAAAYKSFKLLKYYLNATKDELDKVPEWLRPRYGYTYYFFKLCTDHLVVSHNPPRNTQLLWISLHGPRLRDCLVQNHDDVFTNGNLSKVPL
ncbi:hypothetical protein SNOG_00296 [Parastagonospora nodorum SN15]|uniref:BZIP domain-containing protein n=1 Tax=Phaeosphaeria nodorum (strain SN15 / ATCC MYA-4574 / FGSC 10173) TaxID=321614 RepID=Q0V6R8_PHANO|nr:hypothetical protein SNOG_00296 [Parastagonospora nodorum SN15]EAT91791.1 hypothetical protein SNOG_00296 [Parastagonospora nodorum SN15]